MKRIDTTQETATSWSPFKVESKAFMQDANKEMFAVIAKNLIESAGYNPYSVPYLLEKTQLYNQAVYFNGEIYITNVVGGTYAIIDTTPDAVADPTTFSDNTTHNIHQGRKLIDTTTLTGSLFSWSAMIDLTNKINTTLTMINGWSTFQIAPSYKIRNREVVLSGNATTTAGGPTGGTTILCVVPSPSSLRRIVCGTTVNGVFSATLILIDTSGNLTVANATAAVINQINFDGISYTL